MIKTKLNLNGLIFFFALLVISCSKDDGVENPKAGTVLSKECSGTTQIVKYADGMGGYTTNNIENSVECGYIQPVGFNGPTYSDNYSSIASWASRAQWNLANIHDPSVVKDGEYYYMYQTDASYGNAHDGYGHFHHRRSKDLVNWEYRGSTMANAPAWVKESMNANRVAMGLPEIANPNYGYWAPCVRKVGNVFRMYYSLVVNELITGTDGCASWGERPYIGLMETTDLASNQWVDKGMVVMSVPDGFETYTRSSCNDWSSFYKYNGIDPSLIVTPQGENWLVYGSWMTGIASVRLDPDTGKPYKLETVADYGVTIAKRGNSRWQPSEGAEIIYNPDTDYYYLFLAYDELSVAYNTRVARSKSITGPYLGINGANVTNGAECYPMLTHPYSFKNHTGWVGISHCAVFQNPDTKQWFFSSQARLPENVPGIGASNAIMMGQVREIQWTEDGWPVVAPERYAGVPTTEITEASFYGTWEHIDMKYQYKTIQTSSTIFLGSDKKITGGITGTWSYDSANKTLTINGVKCIVQDAWDWEASPRKVTITYSGLTAGGLPYWGKKN